MARMQIMDFLPTTPFKMDYGRMKATDYEKLKSDILDGQGIIIPAAAGLREILIDSESSRDTRSPKYGVSRHGWLVVYAIYQQHKLVVLVTKFKHPVKKKKFNMKEQMALAAMKKRLDQAVEQYFS